MSSLLPVVEVEQVKLDEREIVLSLGIDRQILALVGVKRKRRNSRKVKIYVHLLNSGETFAYECLSGKADSCFRDSIEEPLIHAGLSAAVDTIARVLKELVNEWDERVEAERLTRLGEALTQQYKPLFTIPSGDGLLEVLVSDGFELPEHGAFIDLGDCVAIAETTYAYVRDSRAESGLARIEPVGLIAVYTRSGEGLRLSEVKPFAPKRDHAITVCGRPVRVKRAAAAAVVGSTTFADAKAFEAVLEMGDLALEGISWPSVASEILDRLRESVYLKDERKYYVLASYVLMTYFHDVFTAIPFLWLYGPYGSGKTRTNVTITYMSRRGVIILQPSDASLYRLADAVGATIGIDESALKGNQPLILAGSYKRGLSIPRAEPTKHGILLKLFDSVVPRIFSFKDLPKEDYLLQRIIGVLMEKGIPKRKEDPLPSDYRDLRNKLYMLRLLGLPQILDAKKRAAEILDRCMVQGREREIWWPLLTAALLGGFEAPVLDYIAEDLEKRASREDIYIEEKTVLAAIESTLTRIKDLDGREYEIAMFTASDLQRIIVHRILEEENCLGVEGQDTAEKETVKPECRRRAEEIRRKWNPQKIGKVLERLGFNAYRKAEGKGASKRRYYKIPEEVFWEKAGLYEYTREVSAESVKSVKCLRNIHRKNESTGLTSNDDLENDKNYGEKKHVISSISPGNLTDSTDLTDHRGLEGFFDDS